jgi:hypothetical protein
MAQPQSAATRECINGSDEEEMMDWQPIETAPKDQWVLTYDLVGIVPSNKSRFVVAKWAYDDQWWFDVVLKRTYDDFENWPKEYLTCCPRYWMQLPEPPK